MSTNNAADGTVIKSYADGWVEKEKARCEDRQAPRED